MIAKYTGYTKKLSLTSFYQYPVYCRYLFVKTYKSPWPSIIFHWKAPSYFIKPIFYQQTFWLFPLFIFYKDSFSEHPWTSFLQLPGSFLRINFYKLNFWIKKRPFKILIRIARLPSRNLVPAYTHQQCISMSISSHYQGIL